MVKKLAILLLFLSYRRAISLGINDLDDIFDEDECIEGEFALQNSEDFSAEGNPSNIGDVILLKSRGINLSSRPKEGSSLLVEMKNTIIEDKNALNKIHELAQFNKISIEFILIGEVGDAHDKTFRVRLTLGDEAYQGSGRKIQDAKRKAAQNALSNTQYSRPPIKTSDQIMRDVEQLTPTVHLNSIAGKLGMKVEYYNEGGNVFVDSSDKYVYYSLDSSRKHMFNASVPTNLNMKTPSIENQPRHGPFRVRVDVAGESFTGTGWTVQSARHDAAAQALEMFRKMSLQDAEECLSGAQLCNKLSIKSPISLLYETAAKHQWDLAFDVISEDGPAHKRLFVTRCKMADMSTEGEGGSKKESKRKAAEAMMKLLENVQPWDLINVQNIGKKKKKKSKKNKITRPGMLREATMNVLDAFATMSAANDGGDGGAKSDHANEKGPKGELLALGREIGIGVRFSSYQNEDGDQHAVLVSLDTNPAFHCYNKDQSSQLAEDNAALNALKFLKHVGLNNIMIPLKNPDGKKVILLEEIESPNHKTLDSKVT